MSTQTLYAREIATNRVRDWFSPADAKEWFSTIEASLSSLSVNRPQHVYSSLSEFSRDGEEDATQEATGYWSFSRPVLRKPWGIFGENLKRSAEQSSRHDSFTQILKILDTPCAQEPDQPMNWSSVFAYTDFEPFPAHFRILVLAVTAEAKSELPARRTFFLNCGRALKARGLPDSVLVRNLEANDGSTERKKLIERAHMIACLEEPVATAGYVQAAIRFVELQDVRNAMAAIYRNVRYRTRDDQFNELDSEIDETVTADLSIDILLAVLTATAPFKKRLKSRKKFFREARKTLKLRRELEPGILDGLH